jgi:hypothetical protein
MLSQVSGFLPGEKGTCTQKKASGSKHRPSKGGIETGSGKMASGSKDCLKRRY